MRKRINFFSDYLQQTYGNQVYRVPIDLDSNCPNRNAEGKGGCIFCNENGGRSMQTSSSLSLEEQIDDGINFAKKRYNAKHFMLYIQAFSALFNKEKQIIYNNLIEKNFKAIIFATRPDCLNKEAYIYLCNLQKKIDVWIELGIQTTHNKTLQNINRGHTWEVSKKTILELDKNNIPVAVHVILGLPKEKKTDMIDTAKKLSCLPIKAIKIHNLHVLENTALAGIYKKEQFITYSEYEYSELLVKFLRHIRRDILVMRINTDSPKESIIAPRWNMNKSHFKEYLLRKMIFMNAYQGDNENELEKYSFKKIKTMDDSITMWSEEFKEHYHEKTGALKEAQEKYLKYSKIENKKKFQVLDVGFGMGYNSLVTANYALSKNIYLNIEAVEIDKRIVQQSSLLKYPNVHFNWNACLEKLYSTGTYKNKGLHLKMFWGDAREQIKNIDKIFDTIYLDAFSTQRNSELWTLDFFLLLKDKIKKDGILLTYSSAVAVRHALHLVGFYLGELFPKDKESKNGTIATLNKENLEHPIAEEYYKLFETTRGIVYRDPFLVFPNKEILRQREKEIERYKEKISI
jgi:uncharacterized protein